jgi:hypothetical protein
MERPHGGCSRKPSSARGPHVGIGTLRI